LPVSIMAWIRNRREIKVGPMIEIGYARVSSIDQNLDRQNAALRVEELSKAIDALPTKGVLVVSLDAPKHRRRGQSYRAFQNLPAIAQGQEAGDAAVRQFAR